MEARHQRLSPAGAHRPAQSRGEGGVWAPPVRSVRPGPGPLVPSLVVALQDASPARRGRSRVLALPDLRRTSPEDWAQLVRVCVVGASGFVVNLVVFALLFKGLGVHYLMAAI